MRTVALALLYSFGFLLGVTIGFLIGSFVFEPAAQADPHYSVDEFIQNHDGTSTLLVTCASGKEIRFTIPDKRLNMLDEEGLYQIIKRECK